MCESYGARWCGEGSEPWERECECEWWSDGGGGNCWCGGEKWSMSLSDRSRCMTGEREAWRESECAGESTCMALPDGG